MRAPKSGGQPTGFAYQGSLVTSATLEGNALYFTDIGVTGRLWQLALPNGPISEVTQFSGARLSGLALSSTYFYVIDSFNGMVERVHRTTHLPNIIYNAYTAGVATGNPPAWRPIVGNGRLYFGAYNPQLPGIRYVMHCVD